MSERRQQAAESECEREARALGILFRAVSAPDGRHAVCASCGETRRFHRVAGRRAYACGRCGKHLYPAASTPFAKSSVPLSSWFDIVAMLHQSPLGSTTTYIASRLDITYKRAWRMRRRIEECTARDGADANLLETIAAAWGDLDQAHSGVEAVRDGPEARICAAACRVMAEQGRSATRIIDIARAAGLSTASVHYYFRTKDEVLLAAFRWACEQSHSALLKALDEQGTPIDRLRRLLQVCVPSDRTLQDEYLLWLDVWVRVRSHPRFLSESMKMSEQWYHAVHDMFRSGVEEGVFTPVTSLDEICQRFVLLSESLAYRATVGYKDLPPDRARRVLARFAAEQLGIPVAMTDPTPRYAAGR